MFRCVCTSWLILHALSGHAQDTIIRQNRHRIAARILEVGIREIRYKRWSAPDGPLFIVNREDVFAIRYSNGYFDTITAPADADAKPLMQPAQFVLIERRGRYYRQGEKLLDHRALDKVTRESGAMPVLSALRRDKLNRRVGKAMLAFGIPLSIMSSTSTLIAILEDKPVRKNDFAIFSAITTIPAILLPAFGTMFVNRSRAALDEAVVEYNRFVKDSARYAPPAPGVKPAIECRGKHYFYMGRYLRREQVFACLDQMGNDSTRMILRQAGKKGGASVPLIVVGFSGSLMSTLFLGIGVTQMINENDLREGLGNFAAGTAGSFVFGGMLAWGWNLHQWQGRLLRDAVDQYNLAVATEPQRKTNTE